QLHRFTASGDDGGAELQHLLAAFSLDLEVIGIHEASCALYDLHLARLGHTGQPAGELAHNTVFVGAKLVEIDGRLAKRNTVGSQTARFVQDRNTVQQCLGRNAADIQADAAQCRVALNEHDLEPKVRRAEGGRVPAGTRPQDHHI